MSDPTSDLTNKFIVRHYDGFDNEWIDVSGPVSKDEANKIYAENTNNGKHNTSYNDIDYYRIFPAGTTMLFSAHDDDPQDKA